MSSFLLKFANVQTQFSVNIYSTNICEFPQIYINSCAKPGTRDKVMKQINMVSPLKGLKF